MNGKIVCGILSGFITASTAWAGSVVEDALSSCTGINCGTMTLRGLGQANEPFLLQVYAAAGECLRLDVNSQTQDTAMGVLFPSVGYGFIYDDRDFDGGDTRPLAVIDPVPWSGWYTVAISYYDLDSRVSRFVLKYGRYPGGNPNCVVPETAAKASFQWKHVNPAKVAAPAADHTTAPD